MHIKHACSWLFLGPALVVSAQSVPGTPAQTAGYESFLRNLAFISSKADSLDTAGAKNQRLKQGVCDSLALSGADCNLMFQIAVAANAQLKALDTRATAIIAQVRAEHPHKAHADGTVVPPPPAELSTLQAQREALVKSAAAALQQQLSAPGAAALAHRVAKRKP